MPAAHASDRRRLPRHVGIIMDGNGRWAQQRGLERVAGHRVGADSVRDVVRAARQIDIEALTLYAFSSQNWARPMAEVAALMDLLREYLLEERQEIMDNDIRLRAIGDIERLPPHVLEPLQALIAESSGNRSMALTLALSYGGRESLVAAVRRAVEAAMAGHLQPSEIDNERFGQLLPTTDLPPLDLLIRTSGERRVSNFRLGELAYAELYFADAFWPDFRRHDFYAAVEDFARRERRFGLTSHQVVIDSDLGPAPQGE